MDEPARFDPECLENLCHRIGEVRAEAEVALALHRISEGLPKLAGLVNKDEATFLQEIGQIARDAELIGMATLARVAHSVRQCHADADHVALGATLARVQRVGERSIHAVWDLEDLSG
ncbi:hypothetical protein HKCCE4037_04255 [Rhodobacterales bacterium HKCCE4037]|nr:hypothetical protein [Rhodobacterales bacterium HKCCE4037]